jgi:DNA-binding MarR family transcriptional regulator
LRISRFLCINEAMATGTRRARPKSGNQAKKGRMFDPSLDYGFLPSLTGFALRRASLLDFGRFGDALGDRSITPLRYSLLEVVGANPGLQQVQVAEILGLAKPAATLAIDFWESRDCVERRKAERDRRSYGIFLTETGKQTLAKLQRRVFEHDRKLTSCLTENELENLRESLRKIYNQ